MTHRILLRVFVIIPMYLLDDWRDSRWLPWWRRYAPSLCLVLETVAVFGRDRRLDDLMFWCWAVAFICNWWTARRNKRNGKDLKAKEAAQAALTAVQQRCFNQQVAEANG